MDAATQHGAQIFYHENPDISRAEAPRTRVLVGSGVREALSLAGGAAEKSAEVRALLVALGGVDLVALEALGLEDLRATLGLAGRDVNVRHGLAVDHTGERTVGDEWSGTPFSATQLARTHSGSRCSCAGVGRAHGCRCVAGAG